MTQYTCNACGYRGHTLDEAYEAVMPGMREWAAKWAELSDSERREELRMMEEHPDANTALVWETDSVTFTRPTKENQ